MTALNLCQYLTNVENKRLTYSGVSELSQKPWPKLQKLWLDANNISDDGLSLVISKFTNSETLLSLGKKKYNVRSMWTYFESNLVNNWKQTFGNQIFGFK